MSYPADATPRATRRRMTGLGFWPFTSSSAPSADTVALNAVRDAARAAANAAAYGTDADQDAAAAALQQTIDANKARVATLEQQETPAPSFLDQLRASLGSAGKYVAIAGLGLAAIYLAPLVLRRRAHANPRRRHRHRVRRARRRNRRGRR